ncbi:MAG TPA: sensor histidine kinase [Candidatus Acidoferrales bacterium]|nr:sensor histidine kinase [Candidatus Acidoferrales bacterium]
MATMIENPAEASWREPEPPSGRLRWLLLGVCAALLVLLLVAGAVAVRFLDDMHTQELAVTHALAERTQMLAGLWLSIQSYNQAVQEFVTQAQVDRDEAARQRLDQLTTQIDGDLRRYPATQDTEEILLLRGMQAVFLQQRTLYVSVLEAPKQPPRRKPETHAARSDIIPVQQQILDWSAKLRSWNREQLQHADRTLVGQFAALQSGLTRALAIAFASGLLLVLVSMVYIVRLERQTRLRYVELARSRHQLQLLSSRLVDAQENERRSISRELHDQIGQALGALLVDIGRLTASVSGTQPELKAQLDQMKSVAEGTFQEVRNIALLLRPSMLDDLGLAAALEWQGREISRRSEIEVDVDSDHVPEDLPDEYNICIYRLVQEALTNAVRHSGARNAKVAVERPAGAILVRVHDDGHGFDPGRTRGLGLVGMEERVKRLGGTFSVESVSGTGTTLSAELPYPSLPEIDS